MAVNYIPDGFHSITPALVVEDGAGLIDFMKSTFGATERMRMPMPDGGIAHAEMDIAGSPIMLGDATPENPVTFAAVYVYVEDVDAAHDRAIKAGATSTMAPEDRFWGDRVAEVRDPFGNRWSIGTHVEDVDDAEMQRRMAAMASG